jgi:hypothetical protein
MMDWKALIQTVAPWIGTALGGPLGGMAVSAVGDALGLSDKTEAGIKAALAGASPEQMLALKQADQAFALKMQELGFENEQKIAELAMQDRDSARKREAAVQDWTPRVLAYALVGAFIAVIVGVLAGWGKADSVLAGTLIGYLSAKAEQVVAYYFGSSSGSDKKTEIMAKAAADAAK